MRAIVSLLVLVVAVVTAVPPPALGAESAPENAATPEKAAAYDLTVIVYAPDAGPAQVAIGYPRVVDHAAIQKGLGELVQRTGAVISSTQIRDEREGRGMGETGTAVEFAAAGLIPGAQGALPVGPIIRSLPEWQHMRLAFVVGEAFPWIGPGTTMADGFAVQLVSSMKPIEYDVERKSSRLAPPAVTTQQKAVSAAAVPAVLIGLPAGFLIGWLTYGAGGARARRS
jgi:hypothetical protein